jgi:hypothetical protein
MLINAMLEQRDPIMLIFIVFLKLAADSFLKTFDIHHKKYTSVGNMQI